MRSYLIAVVLLVSLNSSAIADDLMLFQGVWEMKASKAGAPVRVVKTIEGNQETVEVYTDGELTQRHHVDFELKEYGPAKVFVWKNGRLTAGPRAGQALPDGRFIYRINRDTLTGVHGMLEGDNTSVIREVYKRISELPEQPAL